MSEITTFNTKVTDIVQLLSEADIDSDNKELKESLAAVGMNPTITWAKFILTDNLPNINKQRIPLSEFTNLIKTGIFMPIKKAWYTISSTHDEVYPLGVITNLKHEKDETSGAERITGIAGLWSRERPQDIDELKEMAANGEQIDLSWEILYEEAKVAEDGIHDLYGTALKATTIVSNPAYAGRTRIMALATNQGEGSTDPNTITEENKLEELEILKTKVTDLEDKLLEAEKALATEKELSAAKDEELVPLKEFKATVEKAEQDELKISEIKAKFVEAKIEKSDEYFTEKRETLLGLSAEELDFIIQELVSFTSKEDNTETSSTRIPRLTGETSSKPSAKELAEYLKSKKK